MDIGHPDPIRLNHLHAHPRYLLEPQKLHLFCTAGGRRRKPHVEKKVANSPAAFGHGAALGGAEKPMFSVVGWLHWAQQI